MSSVGKETRDRPATSGTDAERSQAFVSRDLILVIVRFSRGGSSPVFASCLYVGLPEHPLQVKDAGAIVRETVEKGNPRMLVLSRRPNEKILFPDVNVAVQVMAVKPGVVRLGIDAPPEMTVLRDEVLQRMAEWNDDLVSPEEATAVKNHKFNHLLRHRLKVAGIGLGLLRLQLEAGQTEEAKATLEKINEGFQLWRQRLEGEMEEDFSSQESFESDSDDSFGDAPDLNLQWDDASHST